MRLSRVGLDAVIGAIDEPAKALAERPDLAATASRLTTRQLAEARAKVPALVLLDVRSLAGRAHGCVADSAHIPLVQLRERADEVDPGRPVVAYCAGGNRSSIAASLLRARGFADVSDLIGGYQGWAADEHLRRAPPASGPLRRPSPGDCRGPSPAPGAAGDRTLGRPVPDQVLDLV